MSESGIRITRNDRTKLQAIIRENPNALSELVRGAAQEVTNEIVLSFGTSVSAPGDPPGVDTGALRASMGWEMDGRFKAFIFAATEYAPYLEFGTSKMPARPFVSPVFESWRLGEFTRFVKDFGLIR